MEMKTMEDRWDEFNKRYPDTDYRALNDAKAWESDRDYIRLHLQRVNMRSERFGLSIAPSSNILGMDDVVRTAHRASRSYLNEEDSLERAFRIFDITLHIASNLKDDLSEDNIKEWLDWKGVVNFYIDLDLYLPSGLFYNREWDEATAAIKALDELQPRCPTCNAVGWRSEMNNLGQTVYLCDSWMCLGRYVSDMEN